LEISSPAGWWACDNRHVKLKRRDTARISSMEMCRSIVLIQATGAILAEGLRMTQKIASRKRSKRVISPGRPLWFSQNTIAG